MTDSLTLLAFFLAGGWLGILTIAGGFLAWRVLSHEHVHSHPHNHGNLEETLGVVLVKLRSDLEGHRHDVAGLSHAHFWVATGDRYLGPRGKPTQKFRCALPGCSGEAAHELE